MIGDNFVKKKKNLYLQVASMVMLQQFLSISIEENMMKY